MHVRTARVIKHRRCACGCRNHWSECLHNAVNYSPWDMDLLDYHEGFATAHVHTDDGDHVDADVELVD